MSDNVMTSLTNTIESLFGPYGTLILPGALGLLLIIVALPMLSMKKADPFTRLDREKSAAREETSPNAPALRNVDGAHLKRFSNFLEPQDEEELSAVRTKLMQAGYKSPSAVRLYYFAQFALGLGLLTAGGLWLWVSRNGNIDTNGFIKFALAPCVIGYMAPKYWVTRRQAERSEEIAQGFPDSLDMMLVCVEAGQSLDQAIVRVAAELRTGFPALAEEYEIVAHQMKAGKDKTTVLRDLAARVDNDDVSSFVTVLIQSQAYGTPISEALRVYAGEMRDKRVMRAEEKANTLPTKLTLTTMMLTVPPLLVILLSPSLIDISQAFYGG